MASLKFYLTKYNLLNNRSSIVVKNAFISFFIKGFSILISFALIPLYLKSVNQREYGIILTITSIASWISFFDVGVGNGLRNKLGMALANKDFLLARKYVSTAYLYIGVIFAGIFLLYLVAYPYINWSSVLKLKANEVPNIDAWLLLVVFLFIIRFVLQLVGIVLLANQKSFINDAILPIANVVTIALYYLLKFTHHINFYYLLLTITAAPVIVLFAFSIVLYIGKYRWLSPGWKYVDYSLRKDLLGLGMRFFVIQIVSLIIFSTSNILITQLFTLNDVTPYNIAFKYYNISLMVFTIIITPLWGAFTHAWYQHDTIWIENAMKKMFVICLVMLVLNTLQIFVYPTVSYYWLGKIIAVPTMLAISMVVYNFISCYNNIFAYFLNGIGEINIQLYCAIIGGVINIPLTIWMAKYTNLGLSSIVIANLASLLPSTVFTTIQTIRILKRRKAEAVTIAVS